MRSMSQARRVPRHESQARTRARLLDAAEEVFVEKGIGAASVEEIAARAGYTRGAVYANFADKDALFAAVLDARLARRTDEIAALAAGAQSPVELIARLRAEAGSHPDTARWFVLYHEFWLQAMRDPDVRARLVAYERAERAQLERAVRWQYDQAGVAPTFPVELAALVVQALDRGIFLARLLDEDIPRTAFFDALDHLARSEGVNPGGPPDGER
jgi:AcrR family transcriptional regulator